MAGQVPGVSPAWCCEHEVEPPVDVVIQAPSQSIAYRILVYFRDKSSLVPSPFYPERVRLLFW